MGEFMAGGKTGKVGATEKLKKVRDGASFPIAPHDW